MAAIQLTQINYTTFVSFTIVTGPVGLKRLAYAK